MQTASKAKRIYEYQTGKNTWKKFSFGLHIPGPLWFTSMPISCLFLFWGSINTWCASVISLNIASAFFNRASLCRFLSDFSIHSKRQISEHQPHTHIHTHTQNTHIHTHNTHMLHRTRMPFEGEFVIGFLDLSFRRISSYIENLIVIFPFRSF